MARVVKKPEERRAEIVAAARRLFETRGFEATSMQDVIDEVGIAKGTIYHYFASKGDLLHAVVDDVVAATTEQMRAIAARPGTALERLRAVALEGAVSARDAALLERLPEVGGAMRLRLLCVAVLQQGPLYAEILEQGRAEGVFHVEDPLVTAELLLGGVQLLTDARLHPWPAEELARRATGLPAALEHLLGAAPGTLDFLRPPA